MSLTIQNANDDLAGIIHGGSTNKITNLTALHWRAGRNIISKIDPLGTMRRVNLSNTIYDKVFDYGLPSDFKEIIDLRPQVNRNTSDNFTGRFAEPFDLRKNIENNMVEILSEEAVRKIRIKKKIFPAPVVINAMNDLDDNGVWSASGSATEVEQDTIFKVSGSGSIKFNAVATGDGIKNNSMTEVDLTDHDEVSRFFYWVYLPDASLATSMGLIFGNDLTTNFWTSIVATTQFDGTAFRDGWNLVGFAWADATETGTVDPSEIDSIRIVYNGDPQDNIRIDALTSSIGEIFEIVYYSKFMWRNSSGTFIEKPTSDDDIINLDEDAYNIYVNELAYLATQQLQGEDSAFDKNFFAEELYGSKVRGKNKPGLYEIYNKRHPSERLRQQDVVYRIKKRA